MIILAIDPGPVRSAWAVMDGTEILSHGLELNNRILVRMTDRGNPYTWANPDHLAIEMIASYGRPVGAEIFETCVWIGRFIERWGSNHTKIMRLDVKKEICHSGMARDPHIRQAIIDLHPHTGGGKIPQIGTKAKPGPLYGVKADIWAAIGVGLTYNILHGKP